MALHDTVDGMTGHLRGPAERPGLDLPVGGCAHLDARDAVLTRPGQA